MSWEVRLSSNQGGKTIAFHPKRVRDAGVRIDGSTVTIMWAGGHLVVPFDTVASSWQQINDGAGSLLPIKLKRAGFAAMFGVKALDVRFT